MFHTRWYRWTGVALGMLLGGGVAVAAPDSGGDTSAQEDQSSSGDTAGCKEAGVTVTFGTGSTSINARGRTSLNAVAKWAKGEPGRTIRVDGYTDKTGNPEKNKVLSEKRADAVKTYLVARASTPDRIATTAHGQEADRPDLEEHARGRGDRVHAAQDGRGCASAAGESRLSRRRSRRRCPRCRRPRRRRR